MNRSRGPARTTLCLLAGLAACANGGLEVAPDDLDARDLLGLDPALTLRWDAEERAAARAVLDRALAAAGEERVIEVASSKRVELARALDRADWLAASRGEPARLLWRIADGRAETIVAGGLPPAPGDGPAVGAIRLSGWEAGQRIGWGELAVRRPEALVQLAERAGRSGGGTLTVEPAAQASFAAAYVAGSDRLLINPVLLAALEPDAAAEVQILSAEAGADVEDAPVTAAARPPTRQARAGGNPYNFYGSLAECAAAERARCDGCLPAASCEITTSDATDGQSECTTLAAESGRGYFLICASTAMAIATVADCLADAAPACPRNEDVGRSVLALTANAALVDDATCRAAVDRCLADLYGDPDGEFPPPPADGGVSSADGGVVVPPPSRDVDVDCTSCDNDTSCNFSPDCSSSCVGCSDSSSSGGSDEDGCGDGCNSCSGNSCEVGCTESDTSSGSDSESSCGSCDSSSDSSSESDSSCDCSSGDSSSESDSSCGDCGSGGDCGSCGSCGSDTSSESSSSNSSCGNCQAAPRRGPPRQALLGGLWGLLPLVVMGLWRRRTRAGGAA